MPKRYFAYMGIAAIFAVVGFIHLLGGGGMAATVMQSALLKFNGSTITPIVSTWKLGLATTTADTLFAMSSTATTTMTISSSSTTKGACLVLKDSDGSGFTYCIVNGGTMTCSTNKCY